MAMDQEVDVIKSAGKKMGFAWKKRHIDCQRIWRWVRIKIIIKNGNEKLKYIHDGLGFLGKYRARPSANKEWDGANWKVWLKWRRTRRTKSSSVRRYKRPGKWRSPAALQTLDRQAKRMRAGHALAKEVGREGAAITWEEMQQDVWQERRSQRKSSWGKRMGQEMKGFMMTSRDWRLCYASLLLICHILHEPFA